MSNSPSINCPKCLEPVLVSAAQAGTRISCPSCGASLVVPETVVADNAFDDLFDESEPPTDVSTPVEPEPVAIQPQDQNDAIPEPAIPDDDDLPVTADEASMTQGDQAVFDTGWIDDLKAISAAGAPDAEEQTEITEASPDTAEHANPFEYDETKSIRIEGISPNITGGEGFYVKCSVCDSELHATEQQIGQKVQCTDCLSEIRIAKPKNKDKFRNNWQNPATIKRNDSDDELKLEAPVERPKIDIPIEDGFGLEEVASDLLAPIIESEVEIVADPKPSPQKDNLRTKRSNRPQAPVKRNPNQPKSAIPKNVQRKPPQRIPQSNLVKPISWNQLFELKLTQDIDLIIRSVVVVVFLSFGYVLADSVWETLGREDLNGGEKFGRLLPAAIGVVGCMTISTWFLSITISVLMRAIANGFKKVEEWVGFAPSEWMGSFAVVAFGIWASSLPGVLFGYFMWKLTSAFILLPMLTAISCFLLMPIFLISSFHNESAFNIFSGSVVSTLSSSTELWIAAFQYFGLCLGGFLLGTLVLLIPGLLFCFIGAAIQVVSITLFAVFLGLQARTLVDRLQA